MKQKDYQDLIAPHCRQCGYNLTGLAEKRCPECGAPFGATTPEPPKEYWPDAPPWWTIIAFYLIGMGALIHFKTTGKALEGPRWMVYLGWAVICLPAVVVGMALAFVFRKSPVAPFIPWVILTGLFIFLSIYLWKF